MSSNLNVQLSQKLSLLLVIRNGGNKGYNGDRHQNGEAFNPSCGSVGCVCETHFNTNREESTNDKYLKHEVLERLPDQGTERSSGWLLLGVVSVSCSPCFQGTYVDSLLRIDINTIKDGIDSSEFVLHVSEFLDVLSLTIALDDLDQLLFRDLESMHAGLSAGGIIFISHLLVCDR